VNKVVAKISESMNKRLPLDVGEHVIGMEQVAKKIIQMLEDKKTVLMLGLGYVSDMGCKKDCLSLLSAPPFIHWLFLYKDHHYVCHWKTSF
jgi:hypothetical protein